MKLLFATHNPNKLREIQQLMPAGFEVVDLTSVGLSEEIPETGTTIEENSAIKSQFVFDRFGISCFADDSGLEVAALNNEPGVYSARYAGEPKNDQANLTLLLKNLGASTYRLATFKTVITYIEPTGQSHQFTGTIKGRILYTEKGTGGFGYDPIFQPDGYTTSFAEMPAEQKNKISHRAQAFNQFLTFLKSKL